MAVIRVDKMLSNCGVGSRKDIKKLVKFGKVTVDGKVVVKSDVKIDTDKNLICVDGENIIYKKYIYLVMNKPSGVISATEDKSEKTVIDILPEKYKKFHVFPVGRLDKNTVGLLILTNDGEFAHNTLSPKKHIWKRYFSTVSGIVSEKDIEIFIKGVELENNEVCKSAKLDIFAVRENETDVFVDIAEGKFHQIKKMFAAVGKKVLYLKRVGFGGLTLDESIAEGETRELSEEEFEKIFEKNVY